MSASGIREPTQNPMRGVSFSKRGRQHSTGAPEPLQSLGMADLKAESKAVQLSGHLWEALDLMAREMGVPKDALIAQGVFTLARLNGYVVPGRVELHAAAPAAPPPQVASAMSPRQPAPAPPPAKAAPAPAPAKVVSARGKVAPEPEPSQSVDEPEAGNPFDEAPEEEPQPSQSVDEAFPEPDASQAEEELPPEEDAPPPDEEEPPPEEELETHAAPSPPAQRLSLTLVMAGRDPHKMVGDTLTLGRGKTCEYVIDSNRVSREHARVVREGSDFWLEDLNSSNGTFFGPAKEKVSRRKIKDNDEFTFGTEKVRFQLRR